MLGGETYAHILSHKECAIATFGPRHKMLQFLQQKSDKA